MKKSNVEVKASPADIKKAIAALDTALANTPATPWKAKAAIHPEGTYTFAVTYIWGKAPDADKAVQVSPSVTVEPGKSVGLRVQLTSSAGAVTESFSVWVDQAKGEAVWIGLGPVLQALESGAVDGYAAVEALIGKTATFTVRHEVVPARDKFPAYKRATIRPEKKA
jgi:hypothetical protein